MYHYTFIIGEAIGKPSCAPCYMDNENAGVAYEVLLHGLPLMAGEMAATEAIHRPSWYGPNKCKAILANRDLLRMEGM